MKTSLCPVWSRVEDKSEGVMYGLLLESVQYYVIQDVGEDMWKKILEHAGFNKNMVFTTHNTYKDEMMTSLAQSCVHVTKSKDFNEWMTFFGTCFVEFCTSYGYDKLLRVAGRNYRDFLYGIDNIHEVIRFSYPRLQSPAFLVLNEDKEGCVMLYQSKRRGFKHYVIGQLQQIAKRFYNVAVTISVIEEEIIDKKCHVKFRLDFDNSAYVPKTKTRGSSGIQHFSSITGDTFLKVFPFCIVFNSQLVIRMVGNSIAALLKGDNLIGTRFGDKFHIRRPLIPCIWTKILQFRRVIFEVEYLVDEEVSDLDRGRIEQVESDTTTANHRVLLRGQMKYIESWNMLAFLCTPLLCNLQDLQKAGLFINDLNLFDMSRDMVMAGWQHASQLERSIEEQRKKSEKITENMTKFEEWKQKSDSLLYSMIPQSVASKLKSGADPISTCEVFDNVTIMFNYMVGFGDVCSSATPMEIVRIINSVFSLFDKIIDSYDVFKVETLGDAVYMVAGGVPDRNPNHAINVAGLALELQTKAKTLTGPWSSGYQLNTRIGMHTGSVVGGVVGRRMPQYCLFGDTVNTASRMQTYSMPGRIHISEPCQECLKGSSFVTIVRGTVNVKGKGEMRTFWLAGREGEESTKQFCEEIKQERNQSVRKYSSYENAMDLHAMHASTSYAQLPANFGGMKSNRSSSTVSLVDQIDNDGGPDLKPGERAFMKGSPRSSLIKLNEYRSKPGDIAEEIENQTKSCDGIESTADSPLETGEKAKFSIGGISENITEDIGKSGIPGITVEKVESTSELTESPQPSAEIKTNFTIPKIIENDSVVVQDNEKDNKNKDYSKRSLKLRRIKLSLPKLPELFLFKHSSKLHNSFSDEIKTKPDTVDTNQFSKSNEDLTSQTKERKKITVFLGSEGDFPDDSTDQMDVSTENDTLPSGNQAGNFFTTAEADDDVFSENEVDACDKKKTNKNVANLKGAFQCNFSEKLTESANVVSAEIVTKGDKENGVAQTKTSAQVELKQNGDNQTSRQSSDSISGTRTDAISSKSGKSTDSKITSLAMGVTHVKHVVSHAEDQNSDLKQAFSVDEDMFPLKCPFASLFESTSKPRSEDVKDEGFKCNGANCEEESQKNCKLKTEHFFRRHADASGAHRKVTSCNELHGKVYANGLDLEHTKESLSELCQIQLEKLKMLENGIKKAWGLTEDSDKILEGNNYVKHWSDSKLVNGKTASACESKNHRTISDSNSVHCIQCWQEREEVMESRGSKPSAARISRSSTSSDLYENNRKVVFMISDDESETS